MELQGLGTKVETELAFEKTGKEEADLINQNMIKVKAYLDKHAESEENAFMQLVQRVKREFKQETEERNKAQMEEQRQWRERLLDEIKAVPEQSLGCNGQIDSQIV